MISAFEAMAREYPNHTFFTFVGTEGEQVRFTYRQCRMMAASLAQCLLDRGVTKGSSISVDIPNHPIWPILVLAAAFGGFSLVLLNHELSAGEKLSRLLELERSPEVTISYRIDRSNVDSLFARASNMTLSERSGRNRAVYPNDVAETMVHFAERAAHLFSLNTTAIIAFSSFEKGVSRAVRLTWAHLRSAAKASNAMLRYRSAGTGQIVLPMHSIWSLQSVVFSLFSGSPFVMYQRFEAEQMLRDVLPLGVTHVAVSERMLEELLATRSSTLRKYAAIICVSGFPRPRTVQAAEALRVSVIMTSGAVETSGWYMLAPAGPLESVAFSLMPGYRVRIVDPDANGFGGLAVRGPGLFDGYLNARAAMTADGYFLVGVTAALLPDGSIRLRQRADGMFMSGGESVYPDEIVAELMQVPCVQDACVFAAKDPRMGKVPVAFVELDRPLLAQAGGEKLSPQRFSRFSLDVVRPRLSEVSVPRLVLALDSLPRMHDGKVNRLALKELYKERLEVKRVDLFRMRIPLKRPIVLLGMEISVREVIVVRVTDYAGRVGLGECSSFARPSYSPETLQHDASILQFSLAPVVTENVYLHPCEVTPSFVDFAPQAMAYPMAVSAMESAMWDLYGHITGEPLWQLVGGVSACDGATVSEPACAVVLARETAATVAEVRALVEKGFRHVTLSIVPGSGYECAAAVRKAFPHLSLAAHAHQSYTDADLAELLALDSLKLTWIAEPLRPEATGLTPEGDAAQVAWMRLNAEINAMGGMPNVPTSSTDEDNAHLWRRLSDLQKQLHTPLCLDDSIDSLEHALQALRYPQLKCIMVKVSVLGGVQPTLDFIRSAARAGVSVRLGGMLDTGVSKTLHAALQTLPQVDGPGDIGAVSRYFAEDIVVPPHKVQRGYVLLNQADHEAGLGIELDPETMDRYCVGVMSIP